MKKLAITPCLSVVKACLISAFFMPLGLSIAQNSSNLSADVVSVTVKDAGLFGDASMPVHVFKPTLSNILARPPWPVVIFSHGRAGTPVERANLKNPVAFGHVRWWHARGYAVIAAVRPGYGGSSGDPENSGATVDNTGNCTSKPDFHKTAKAAVHATRTAYDWLLTQDWVNKDQILLEGQSVGGLTTVSACSQNWPGVRGCINFAGGAGGSPERSPGKSCGADVLTEQMASYGKTTQLPSIWLYAPNDLYWGEQAPKLWHAAHSQAAQAAQMPHSASFIGTAPIPPDGHRLLMLGGSQWSEPLAEWLKKHGL